MPRGSDVSPPHGLNTCDGLLLNENYSRLHGQILYMDGVSLTILSKATATHKIKDYGDDIGP